MRRREFLKYASGSVCAGLALQGDSLASQGRHRDSERPNFLIIMSDEHNPHVLGCCGDPVVKTPNLDALASRGVVFRNNYCAEPLCVPSRMAFLTGQEPSKTRVWTNFGARSILNTDTPTFAHSLGAAGYDTALIGRMDFNGIDQWHGFGKRLVGSLGPQYPYLKWPLSADLMPGAYGSSRQAIDIAGPGKTAYQAYDEDVTKAAIQYLRDQDKLAESPFCAVVGFVLPHPPYVCAGNQWDYYRDRVTLPQIPPGYFAHLNPAMKHWRKARGVEDLTPDEIRRARAGYYGLVTELDGHVGQILRELARHEFARDTVVIYTSDHGDMAGENGLWWKMNCYQGSVTVPLIVSFPSRWKPAQRSEVTSLMDVAPTILEMANAISLPNPSGSSLLPLLEGGKVEWVNEAFSEYIPEMGVPAMRMIRSGRWKLVYFDGVRPQLFDLENDPQEFNDLAQAPAYAQVRETLMARVLSGWSAEEITKANVGPDVLKTNKILREWAMKVRPPTTAQWVPPPGANRFSEDR